jgi:hypothetical protein
MKLVDANLGDEGEEGKEPPSLGPRVGAAVGLERCTGDANLGDRGNEGKEPSSLEPRVGAAVAGCRVNLGMQILGTRVTKADSHHRWSRACESGGGGREMHLGTANLGDGGDEGKEPSLLGGRVWERRWVSKGAAGECKHSLVTSVTKARAIIVGAACVGAAWWVSRDATWGCKSRRRG